MPYRTFYICLQFNCFSQTSLLSTRIEFKSSKEHSSDSSEDEDISSRLKSKYHVLLPDTSSEKVKQFYSNGQLPAIKQIKQSIDLAPESKEKDGNELGQPKIMLYSRERVNSILDWKRVCLIIRHINFTSLINGAQRLV